MIAHKKAFYGGALLLVGFFVVLAVIFMPVFGGQNGLDYLDGLYNSISKGSAYYIPQAREEVQPYSGSDVRLDLILDSETQVKQAAALFIRSGERIDSASTSLTVSGDLGRMLTNCLDDADAMYANKGEEVSAKYGYEERRALYNWWAVLMAMEKDLKEKKKFKEAKVVSLVQKKAVETAYNYYNIEPQKITDKMGIVIFSLIFYVVYTLWYGFSILYLFEGWGMKLEH